MTFRKNRFLVLASFGFVLTMLSTSNVATAQITTSRILSAEIDPVARLEEQLVNRLHATTVAQRTYLDLIVKYVEEEKLQLELVVAIERYALRRNPRYAFPFFERALRYEASKRGVELPSVRHFQSTANIQ
ncbi:hypothetical protein SAMN06265222_10111 [Neorhodopirellula lusitana]|uniref:Uncharacterized protein n=1 Tax=Neorhodopirellula lusitana TaxID=445327 RepID=A0ABY1PQ65_9BACT|nr:hypothetical protein [Neorhodopirellula lusitana]SMP37700.1 hypothetical protein SAMN06265222_10111 [Neorhodopirellula lusitana]